MVHLTSRVNYQVGHQLRITCASCRRPTRHVIRAGLRQDLDLGDGVKQERVYQILECSGCDEVSMRSFVVNSGHFTTDEESGQPIYIGAEEIYPPRLEGRSALAHDHLLPFEVREIYLETLKALLAEQRILAGIGIRALIEAVCAEKGAQGRNLKEKIEWLAQQGVLAKPGAEILHKLRVMGNDAAHETKPSSDYELATAFDVIEHLLQGVYVLPAKSQSLDRGRNGA